MWPFNRSSRPTGPDAARRLLVLGNVVAFAFGHPTETLIDSGGLASTPNDSDDRNGDASRFRDSIVASLHSDGLWNYVSPKERILFSCATGALPEDQYLSATARLESIIVLMWALGLIAHLPPYDQKADQSLLPHLKPLDVDIYCRTAALRPHIETKVARDYAELWHWRSRTRKLISGDQTDAVLPPGFGSLDDIVRATSKLSARAGTLPELIDEDFPARGMAYRDLPDQDWFEIASIAYERHFTLNWLCGMSRGNRWDDTPTPT